MFNNRFHYFNASQLKYFAAALMFLDHIHQMFHHIGAPIWLTILGRLVFPIFLFLAADSFHYTKNRKAYLWRLLLGSWFMTIASNLIQITWPNPNVVLMNNAFGTFFVTGIMIVGWDMITKGLKTKRKGDFIKGIFVFSLPILLVIPSLYILTLIGSPDASPELIRWVVLLTMMIPNIMIVEGGFILVLLGLAFYIFREKRLYQVLALVLVSFIILAMGDPIQFLMIFAAIPMMMYNGQKGRENKCFFYIFYPGHIYLLYVLSTFFF